MINMVMDLRGKMDTKQLMGLQAMNNPTRIADEVQGTLPAGLTSPSQVTQPTMQLNADLEAGGFTDSGQGNIDQMTQELFNLDQQLEGQYKSPFPQTEGYVDNPADMIGGYGRVASGMAGNIGAAQGTVDATKAQYDRAVSAILDRFMGFYEMQQKQREAQEQREYQRKKDQLDFEMQMAQLTGGTVTNPFTGEKVQVPSNQKDPLDEMVPIDEAVKYGLPIGTTWRDLQGQKIGSGMPATSEEDAILQVISQGGGDLLGNVGVAQKGALAQQILEGGGVQTIRQTLPMTEMMTEAERKEMEEQQGLLQLLDRSIPMFSGGNKLGGTGFLAGMIPNWAPFQGEGREMRGRASEIESELLRMLSGTQVTPSEAQRLQQFIPTRFKSEAQNLTDIQNLKRGININQDIFEYAKRQGKSLAEAYREYGPTAFANAGEQFPDVATDYYANQPQSSPSPGGNSFINQVNAQNPTRFEIIGVE